MLHFACEDVSVNEIYESIMSVRAGEKNPSRGSPIGITRLADIYAKTK